ncbi:MAG: 50S ribosomal protein L13 [Clostridia bacterium]
MSTFMANAQNIERKWHLVDAAGLPLGRVATAVAVLLRGKHKPTFTPHVDCGDFVVIINADKVVLTGNKLDQKFLRHHTGFVGGLKEVPYRELMEKNPERAVMKAVKGMLPHNSLGSSALTRLKVYAGSEHKQQAQGPELYEIKIGG